MDRLQWGYGAMVARLTPDQKVGRSNRSGLISWFRPLPARHASEENLKLLRWTLAGCHDSMQVRAHC